MWAHNGAALVGIIVCMCLLWAWFDQNLKDDDNDGENESPREAKEPNEKE